MVCDSLFKKRRPLVWSKLRTQVLIFKAILGVLLSCFLVEVLKPVLSEVRFDGKMGPAEKWEGSSTFAREWLCTLVIVAKRLLM